MAVWITVWLVPDTNGPPEISAYTETNSEIQRYIHTEKIDEMTIIAQEKSDKWSQKGVPNRCRNVDRHAPPIFRKLKIERSIK